jgi:polysaccharide pyruvyl transferase WcaK-like protein
MKNIFIVGAHPGGNKGAEAMLEVVLGKLSINLAPNEQVNIFVESLGSEDAYSIFKRRCGMHFEYFKFTPKNLLFPYDVVVNKGDVVIDIGGINYHDRSLRANIRSLVRHAFFIIRGAKLVFFTQDHGPCHRISSKIISRFVYSHASQVFMRSELSFKYLSDLCASVNIQGVFPDCTLLLEKSTPSIKLKNEDYVVLAPSSIMFNQYGERYLDAFVSLAEKLSKNYTPVIVVHNFTKNGASSDLTLCRKLYDLTANYGAVLLDEELPPSEYKGIFAGAKFSISSRYHVVVGSFSVGTPSFAIGWSHKYEEFLSLYDKTTLNLKFDDDLVNKLIKQLKSVENEKFYSSEINCKNIELKSKAEESFDSMFLEM